MPRGYVIMTEVIHSPDRMAAHGAVSYDSLVAHDAKMLVVDANYEVREGSLGRKQPPCHNRVRVPRGRPTLV